MLIMPRTSSRPVCPDYYNLRTALATVRKILSDDRKKGEQYLAALRNTERELSNLIRFH